MATATKERITRTRQARGMKSDGAVDMTRGKGENAYTFYQPGIIERARNNDAGIRIIKNGKVMLTNPRMVHRPDLTAVFNDMHENAGEGKYIAHDAISGDRNDVVTGAQHINPYLAEEGSYATIILALQSFCSKRELSKLTGKIHKTRLDGHHIVWNGKTNNDGAIVLGQWVTAQQLWDRALEITKTLKKRLKENESQVKGVREHLGAFEKFCQNLDVIRRARAIFNVSTGEVDNTRGGATPYAMPMEQCGIAIDKYFLTNGFDSEGNEVGEYFYRLAIGRGTPWTLRKRDWRGLDAGTPYAYLSDKLANQAKRAAKQTT